MGFVRYLSDTEAALAAERPFNCAIAHDPRNLASELALECRPPRHEREPEPVVNHGEAARGEVQTPTIRPGEGLALYKRPMRKPGFRGHLRCSGVQFVPTQSVEEIAGKDDAVALPAHETFARQMIDPRLQRIMDLAAEAAFR